MSQLQAWGLEPLIVENHALERRSRGERVPNAWFAHADIDCRGYSVPTAVLIQFALCLLWLYALAAWRYKEL